MSKTGLKIIVVGAGKVGDTLVNRLAEEGHDLVIIDKNLARLTELANLCDCMGIIGNGASHEVLEEAGVASADLFIAVTESDELNLLCCTIAKQFNKKLATIARVRNPDYGKEIPYLRSKLSLEMIINPEYEAAVEAARILYLPAAISINSFAHGSAEIVKIKIPEGNVLHGKTVAYLGSNYTNDLVIVGVERGEDVTIPNGAFELAAGDIISFVATRKVCHSFLKSIGFNTKSVGSTILIGGGKSAFYLADQLIKTGIDVKIIEKDLRRCEELSELLPKAVIINGDGINESLLEETGIRDVDSVVAMTGIDEENIMLSLFARQISKGIKSVTKINKISFTDVINRLDLGSVIYPKHITAEAIISYARARQASIGSNVEVMYHLFDERAEAIEFKVMEHSNVTDKQLKELKLKSNTLVSFINRAGKIIIPKGNDTIEVGDSVMIVTKNKGFTALTDILR
ncbi:MAG: Trk system potassium transporter TrkA [Clostridiales bacterium]|nr:Trk system potassium transporter TrkA [Clostridiales bacterium]